MAFFTNRPQSRKEYQKRMNELLEIFEQGMKKIEEQEKKEGKVLCPYEFVEAVRYISILQATDIVNLKKGF